MLCSTTCARNREQSGCETGWQSKKKNNLKTRLTSFPLEQISSTKEAFRIKFAEVVMLALVKW